MSVLQVKWLPAIALKMSIETYKVNILPDASNYIRFRI